MALTQGAQIDALFEELGWFGHYNRLQTTLALSCVVAASMHMLSIVFIARDVEHRCATLENTMLGSLYGGANMTPSGSCHMQVGGNDSSTQELSACVSGFQYEQPRERSIISEWDLVCERAPMVDLLQTLLTAGAAFGATLFTPLADKFGRKPMFMTVTFLMMATAIGIAFSPNYTTFAILRFFLGAFQQGSDLIGVIIGTELLVTRRRILHIILASLIWGCAMVMLVPIAYLMRELSWRHFELAICLSSLPVLVYYWFADESLRWLAANGHFEEFERIVRKAARMNGKDENKVLDVFRDRILPSTSMTLIVEGKGDNHVDDCNDGPTDSELAPLDEVKEPAPQVANYGISAIFRYKHILVAQLLSCFIWFVNTLTYYGLFLTSSELLDDPYLGFLLNSIVDVPIFLVFIFLIDRFGRQHCSMAFTFGAGVSLLASVTFSNLADSGPMWIASVVFSVLGKFCISVSFSILWLYTPETFPTNVRNAAFGLCSLAGRIGGMAAPFSKALARQAKWAPGVLFGVLCLVATVCIRFLPETTGRELPQRPEDMASYKAPKRKT